VPVYKLDHAEAMQVSNGQFRVVADWLEGGVGKGGWFAYGDEEVQFKSGSSALTVRVGDWLVRLGAGVYAVADSDFRHSFSEVRSR
jgi:hypothetical protein